MRREQEQDQEGAEEESLSRASDLWTVVKNSMFEMLTTRTHSRWRRD